MLSRHPLLIIYKTFIKTHLDFSDTIYDEVYDASFNQNLERNFNIIQRLQ